MCRLELSEQGSLAEWMEALPAFCFRRGRVPALPEVRSGLRQRREAGGPQGLAGRGLTGSLAEERIVSRFGGGTVRPFFPDGNPG